MCPGVFTHGRHDVEDRVAPLFSGMLKSAQRTDIIKRIGFDAGDRLTRDWEMTSMTMPDGSERSQKGFVSNDYDQTERHMANYSFP